VHRRIDLIVDTWRSCHWATTPSRKGVGVSRELFGRQDVECVAAMVLEDWMPADQLILGKSKMLRTITPNKDEPRVTPASSPKI
jgi:hypothetical protein